VVAIVYCPENAFSRTLVPQWQYHISMLIEPHCSCHIARLNVVLLNHPLEVRDAIIWQLTFVGRAADCIRRPFGFALPVGMRAGGVIQG
jgi:hypothetical protein